MKTKIYDVPAVRTEDGKRYKIVTADQYRWLSEFQKKLRREKRKRYIKAAIEIMAIIGCMLLMTGAACKMTDPKGATQIVGICGLSFGLLVTAIVAGVTEDDDDKR